GDQLPLQRCESRRPLPSFPTRRSADLPRPRSHGPDQRALGVMKHAPTTPSPSDARGRGRPGRHGGARARGPGGPGARGPGGPGARGPGGRHGTGTTGPPRPSAREPHARPPPARPALEDEAVQAEARGPWAQPGNRHQHTLTSGAPATYQRPRPPPARPALEDEAVQAEARGPGGPGPGPGGAAPAQGASWTHPAFTPTARPPEAQASA